MSIQDQIIEFTNKNKIHKVIANETSNAEFLQLFYEVFEYYPACTTCGDLAVEYDKLLKWANGKLNYTPKSMANFTLKKDRQVYVRSLQNMVTEFNLTDRVALIMLRESKQNINNFETVPENWEELVVDLDSQPIPEIEAITLQSEEVSTVTEVVEETTEQTSEQAVEEVVQESKAEETPAEGPKSKFQKRR